MSIAISRSSSRVGTLMARRLRNRLASALYFPSVIAARAGSTQLLAQQPAATHSRSNLAALSATWWHSLVQSRSLSTASDRSDHHARMPQSVEEVVRERPHLEVSEYWGVAPKENWKEDRSSWPWLSFKPSSTYTASLGIDVKRHYPSDKTYVDKMAYWTVRFLRKPVDFFFRDHHVSHALMLETVAAVPGMVGGMLLHLRSLRRFEHSGGWIKALLDEAENERMHLMTWVEVLRPVWWERVLVLAVQGGFFNIYFVLYLVSPRLAHRFVGYLEEEAVRSYTNFLEAIDKGEMANKPAPLIAIDYWRLPKNATVRDVVLVIRADEAHHRDVNHFAADVYKEKRELCKSPVPIGYH